MAKAATPGQSLTVSTPSSFPTETLPTHPWGSLPKAPQSPRPCEPYHRSMNVSAGIGGHTVSIRLSSSSSFAVGAAFTGRGLSGLRIRARGTRAAIRQGNARLLTPFGPAYQQRFPSIMRYDQYLPSFSRAVLQVAAAAHSVEAKMIASASSARSIIAFVLRPSLCLLQAWLADR